MSKTDKDYLLLSQMAYSSDLQSAVERAEKIGMTPPYNIGDLVDYTNLNLDSVFEGISYDSGTVEEWSVASIFDRNNDSGCYGALIETGPNEATFTFRGTQDGNDIKTDADLLWDTLTDQHKDVNSYLGQVDLSRYDTVEFTGHSLGGNLAKHGAVQLEKMGYADKLGRVVSYDGPGFNFEYINKNAKSFENIKDHVSQYSYTFVGDYLYEYGQDRENGIHRQYIDARIDDPFQTFGTWHQLTELHLLSHVNIDENGNVIPAEHRFNPLADVTGFASRALSSSMSLFNIAFGAITGESQGFLGDMFTFLGASILGAGATLMGCFSLAVGVGAVLVGLAIDGVKWLGELIGNAFNWIGQQLENFVNAIVDAFNAFGDWLDSIFNYGRKYAEEHPEIYIDTYKMKNYASRLESINNRISNIDSRFKSLYWKVNLVDRYNMMKADMLTGYSNSLASCVSYLNDTATAYENVENEIKNALRGE